MSCLNVGVSTRKCELDRHCATYESKCVCDSISERIGWRVWGKLISFVGNLRHNLDEKSIRFPLACNVLVANPAHSPSDQTFFLSLGDAIGFQVSIRTVKMLVCDYLHMHDDGFQQNIILLTAPGGKMLWRLREHGYIGLFPFRLKQPVVVVAPGNKLVEWMRNERRITEKRSADCFPIVRSRVFDAAIRISRSPKLNSSFSIYSTYFIYVVSHTSIAVKS